LGSSLSRTCPNSAAASRTRFVVRSFGSEIDGRNDDHLDYLVQQLGLAALEPREILLQDREHIVLVAAGLACGMWRDEHVLNGPQRRGRGHSTMTLSAAPLIPILSKADSLGIPKSPVT
jgi:hypothetical protein